MDNATPHPTDAPGNGNGENLRRLRERAARVEELEAEVQRLRTEAALADLGLSDAQRDALLAVHDGEHTPDAFRETVKALGFVEPPQVPFEEQQAHEAMGALTAGAVPSEAHVQTLDEQIMAAQSSEALQALLEREGMLQGY